MGRLDADKTFAVVVVIIVPEGVDGRLKLCTFRGARGPSLGVVHEETIFDLTSTGDSRFVDMRSLYDASIAAGTSMSVLVTEAMEVHARKGAAADVGPREIAFDDRLLMMPLVPAEIWGAGVTYLKSRAARESETKTKGLYDYVYEAVRPELFFKDTGTRCRGPLEEVCIRSDSRWSVPEPELTVVLDGNLHILGYTIGNDVSSRDIEGENPLYLPQAKIYTGSCSIGPFVVTEDEIPDPNSLEMVMRIRRQGRTVYEGTSRTSQMKRTLRELIDFLGRDNTLRTFTLLMTGTPLVPPDDFTLEDGDLVEIEVEKIGLLRNRVKTL